MMFYCTNKHYHKDGEPITSAKVLHHIVELTRAIIFPGYFGNSTIDSHTIHYHIGVEVEKLYSLLVEQIQAGLCFCEEIRILTKLESMLDEYIQSGKIESTILPSTEYCSNLLHLSPSYFSDVLKFETGKTTELYFELKRIEVAKSMLLDDGNISQIVRKLGFSSVQSFSKLFTKRYVSFKIIKQTASIP